MVNEQEFKIQDNGRIADVIYDEYEWLHHPKLPPCPAESIGIARVLKPFTPAGSL
jgi:hypothetical protein